MSLGSTLAKLFERIPEKPWKNDLRYFLSFSPLVPRFIKDMSPVNSYILYYRLRRGDIVVDAGAFPGDYTIFAAKRIGPTGKVIAFEPDERNVRILKRNLRRERLSNVVIVPKGLWNHNTQLNISHFDGLHTVVSNEGSNQITVVRLDDELKELGITHVDVIKMDIEGAEIEAIEGCKATLMRDRPYVTIASYHIRDGKTTSGFIEEYLKKIGYSVKSDFPKSLTTYGFKKDV